MLRRSQSLRRRGDGQGLETGAPSRIAMSAPYEPLERLGHERPATTENDRAKSSRAKHRSPRRARATGKHLSPSSRDCSWSTAPTPGAASNPVVEAGPADPPAAAYPPPVQGGGLGVSAPRKLKPWALRDRSRPGRLAARGSARWRAFYPSGEARRERGGIFLGVQPASG